MTSQKNGGGEIAPKVKIEQKPSDLSANVNVNGNNVSNSAEPPPPPVRKAVSKSPSPPKTTAADQQPAGDGKAAEYRYVFFNNFYMQRLFFMLLIFGCHSHFLSLTSIYIKKGL